MSAAAPAPVFPPEVARWRGEHEAWRAGRPAGEPRWLREIRARGMAAFEAEGFPTTRQEDWRHTSVAPIARTTFARPQPVPAAVRVPPDRPRIVFMNGRYVPELSAAPSVEGVRVLSLREVLDREPALVQPYLDQQAAGPGRPFAALNSAFLDDGAFISVAPGRVLTEPLSIAFFSSPGAETTVSHPRVLVVAGRGSQATVIESYDLVSGGTYLTNAVSEVVLEDGAIVDYYRLQGESVDAFHVGSLSVRQGRASRFTSHAVASGAAVSRVDIRQEFAGEGGECVLNGLFLARGRQHTDVHTWVDHAHPHCTTRELYKGIVDGRARGVFAGRILVRAGAQKTDAIQTNKNLILSREALVDSLPQLEILADDVKCKHGSTTGQLDPVALFYLRSRGIGEEAARALLTYAFASDVVQRMGVEPVRAALTTLLQEWLPGGAEVKEATE